jgi:hypothetical protein
MNETTVEPGLAPKSTRSPAQSVRNSLRPPLLVLAAPRSFSSVAVAILGQHPQMFGLPELQLFGTGTMAEWWEVCAQASFPMEHGLLRAVAELYFGDQTEKTVRRAKVWLTQRSHLPVGTMFHMLRFRVHPLILVEKSPSIVYRAECLQRALDAFPHARFLHVVRHPSGHGRSVLKALGEASKRGVKPEWLLKLTSFPEGPDDNATGRRDPQRSWYVLNRNICQFLKQVPASRHMRIQGEHLLTNPDDTLAQIAVWLGIRADPAALEEMKHPERSPFACLGPPGARLGNDFNFLSDPTLRADMVNVHHLDEPLVWQEQTFHFSEEVKALARSFGYD